MYFAFLVSLTRSLVPCPQVTASIDMMRVDFQIRNEAILLLVTNGGGCGNV
jgi:hypothetical protein